MLNSKYALTQEQVKAVIQYDQESGVFTWKARPTTNCTTENSRKFNGLYAGKVAGCEHRVKGKIYWIIVLKKRKYLAHRLAWIYVHGVWPSGEVDHIDGNPSNNSILNLRDVTSAQNKQNIFNANHANKSGLIGVRTRVDGRFDSTIKINGKSTFLGIFGTKEEAHHAYMHAKQIHHPFSTLAARHSDERAMKEAA